MSEDKNSKGRPSDYKHEYCQMLVDHMAEGYSFASFAFIAGTCEKTLYNWAKEHPDFLQAKNKGRAASLMTWEKIGMAGTVGKLEKFNAASWIFTMKNRFKWGDEQNINLVQGAPDENTRLNQLLRKLDTLEESEND